MFNFLFHFLLGYVIIRIEGKNTEHLINRCMDEKPGLSGLRRHGNEYATAEISPKIYHRIKLYARDLGCKISVVRRGGLPFLLLRLKKRKVFCFGFLFAVVAIVWLCSRVWVIDIAETDPMRRQQISQLLTDYGVVCGMPKSALNSSKLQQAILANHSEYTRFRAEAEGTVLRVEVRYATPPPEAVPTDRVRNLVAASDGVIERIVVRSGEAAIAQGASVKAGQLLISGVTTVTDHGNLYVYADGDIIARTNKKLSRSLPLNYFERIKTGRVTKKYHVNIFGKNFNLFFRPPDYSHYDGVITEKPVKFFGEYFLPITLRIYEYNEVAPTPKTRSDKEAEEELKKNLLAELYAITGEKNVMSYSFETEKTPEDITVTLQAECLESIGKPVEITFENRPFLRADINPEAIFPKENLDEE